MVGYQSVGLFKLKAKLNTAPACQHKIHNLSRIQFIQFSYAYLCKLVGNRCARLVFGLVFMNNTS